MVMSHFVLASAEFCSDIQHFRTSTNFAHTEANQTIGTASNNAHNYALLPFRVSPNTGFLDPYTGGFGAQNVVIQNVGDLI